MVGPGFHPNKRHTVLVSNHNYLQESNSNRLANLTWQKLRFANSPIFLPSTIKTHLQSFGKSHLPKPKEVGLTSPDFFGGKRTACAGEVLRGRMRRGRPRTNLCSRGKNLPTLPNLPTGMPNDWRLFFRVFGKILGCQVLLPNDWSCYACRPCLIFLGVQGTVVDSYTSWPAKVTIG